MSSKEHQFVQAIIQHFEHKEEIAYCIIRDLLIDLCKMRGDAITLAFVSEVLKDLATKAALYNPTCSPQNSQEDEEIGVEKYIMRVVEDVKEVKRKFPSALTQEKYDFMERMVISDLAVLADAWEYTLRLKFNWASQ